jgi:hypothetical protein
MTKGVIEIVLAVMFQKRSCNTFMMTDYVYLVFCFTVIVSMVMVDVLKVSVNQGSVNVWW